MDALDIGPSRGDEEVKRYRRLAAQSLLFTASDDWPEREGLEHLRLARVGGEVVGGLIALPLGQFFGGRAVPAVAVRAVAVSPEHRGRGVALALQHRMLAEQRAAGRPLATLFPAVTTPYRRAGFEVAGTWSLWELPLAALPVRPDAPAMRPVTPEEAPAVLIPLHRAHAERSNGALERSPWAWERLVAPPNRPPRLVYVTEGGYVVFEQVSDVGPRGKGALLVHEAVALDAQAADALRAFLVGHRSRIESLRLKGAPALDPLLLPLADPCASVADIAPWMVRLVDVPAALAARGYPPSVRAEIDLEITEDAGVPENVGRWRLSIADGRGEVEAGGEGRVRTTARGLTPVYTSALDPFAARAAGDLTAPEADLWALAAAFAGPAPWMTDMF